MEFAIQTKGLTKTYGAKRAVDALTLEIREGELFALLGVNGAGKTTTIKMLAGLAQPSSGEAILLGDSMIEDPLHAKAHNGISPQETAIARNLSVLENLALMARVYGAGAKEAAQRAQETAQQLGLTQVAKSTAKMLSGGMQRRLSIGVPTLGLDVIARRELWSVVNRLKGRVTILLTTHYLEELEALSDRVGVMASGKLTAIGTVAELIAQTGAKNFEDAFIALATREGEAV